MTQVVRIPEPCSENWDTMRLSSRGRHCAVCNHDVVDFTDWEPQAISDYLKAQAGTRVCGRFRAEVVATAPESPWLETVFQAAVPLLRKLAAAVLFFFGTTAASGCMGAAKPTAEDQEQAASSDTLCAASATNPDSLQQKATILGRMVRPIDSVEKQRSQPQVLLGEPAPVITGTPVAPEGEPPATGK